MENIRVDFTPADRAILESYKLMCEGLVDYLGDAYEVVLHSLENLDHSVIKIINGYHTGRREGAPITDLALNMLEKIRQDKTGGFITYMSRNKKGEPMKSCTIAIQGERGNIIGLVCMNMYLNTPFEQVVSSFFAGALPGRNDIAQHAESFADSVDDLIMPTVAEVRKHVLSDATIAPSNKNKEIIIRLYAKGIFNLKDSVIKVADLLSLSKNTVYMHLRNIQI